MKGGLGNGVDQGSNGWLEAWGLLGVSYLSNNTIGVLLFGTLCFFLWLFGCWF